MNGWFVGGERYSNSAAKFWPSLIDEAREEFPPSSSLELSAAVGCRLHRRHLFPQIELQEQFEWLREFDMARLVRETIAELEVLGPPSSVTLRVVDGDTELALHPLPADCIDAEIFPYIAAWPLEWAGIPATLWSNAFLSGAFDAEDRTRGLLYSIELAFASRHLSEGLYSCSISMDHTVTALD
jgi:hypothetical protein